MSYSVLKVQFPRELESQRCKYIDRVFKYPSDKYLLDRAIKEYEDLMRIKMEFEKIDPNKCKAIISTNQRLSVQSYTEFGNDLKDENPDSCLIQMMVEQYKKYYHEDQRNAMIEFKALIEISKYYNQNVKSKQFVSSYHGQPAGVHQKPDFSNTVHGDRIPLTGSTNHVSQKTMQEVDIKTYQDLEMSYQQQKKDVEQMQATIQEKDDIINELRNRLSGLASKKLTQGNPDITDLSDKNRPIRLVEEFHKIYDDEWTNALEALSHVKKGTSPRTEEEAIKFLMEIITDADGFCTYYTKKQTNNLEALWQACLDFPSETVFNGSKQPTPTSKMSQLVVSEFKEQRKSNNNDGCIKQANKIFRETELKKNEFYKKKRVEAVDVYIDKVIECLWKMKIQDPAMVLKWPEPGESFKPEHYGEYCQRGTMVKMAVWPAVFLQEGGALMAKGFVMPK